MCAYYPTAAAATRVHKRAIICLFGSAGAQAIML